jgi:hypothetical protein
MRSAGLVAIACLASIACGAGREGEPAAEQSAAIVFGERSPSPADDGVVFLRHGTGSAEVICTGTMIAPNLVVTARHCVAYVNGGAFQCTVHGEPISIGDGGGILGPDVPAESVEVRAGEVPSSTPLAQGREIVSTLSLTNCVNDLAFVVLDRALEVPPAAVRLGTKTPKGEAATVVGYGSQQLGIGEPDWPSRPRKKKHVTIAAVGPDRVEDVTTLLPRTIVTNGPSACSGDSGGPLLSDKTGAVIGVYTNRVGSDDCTSATVAHHYTHLSPFEALALDAFARAGATPMLEKRAAFGEPCESAADCDDAVCVSASDGSSRCSMTCRSSSPCPGGYDCQPPVMLDRPNVCVALAHADAGACTTCDAGASPPVSSSSGGCSFVARPHAPSSVAYWVVVLAVIRRRTLRRCRKPSSRSCRHTRTAW